MVWQKLTNNTKMRAQLNDILIGRVVNLSKPLACHLTKKEKLDVLSHSRVKKCPFCDWDAIIAHIHTQNDENRNEMNYCAPTQQISTFIIVDVRWSTHRRVEHFARFSQNAKKKHMVVINKSIVVFEIACEKPLFCWLVDRSRRAFWFKIF